MKPNFNKCILNITSSIMKKYNVECEYSTIKEVDEKIKDSKHLFFVILDGLGKNIIEANLDEKSFIRQHINDWITSVYPPTTVAATTAALSGISPGQSGWIGWHQYFKDIENEVVLFRNSSAYSDKSLNFNVSSKYIPYEPFYTKFSGVKCRELFPSFKINGFESFEAMTKEMIEISKSNEDTYTYCYWDNPDYIIHEFGISNETVKKVIEELDRNLETLYSNIGKYTSIIVIADHGLIDVEYIYLNDYPDFMDTLELYPSIEARTTAFKVKDKEKFEALFKQYFGEYFELYTCDEFINTGLLGKFNDQNKQFLLDYVSVATDKYCFDVEPGSFVMKATHAGGTEEEMIIPLIILNK